MRSLMFFGAVMLSWLTASTAHAITVKFNGATYTVDSVTISQSATGAEIITVGDGSGGGGEQPTPEEPTPEEPTPEEPTPEEPDPSTGSCVPSSTQECAGTIDWSSPGGRLRTAVSGTDKTVSWVFTTTGNPTYSGDVNISETTGYELVTRRLWISTSAGGAALPSSRCSTEGTSGRKINWAQQSNFLRCSLSPNTTYFLNVKNVGGCSSAQSCGFYRNIGTSGNP